MSRKHEEFQVTIGSDVVVTPSGRRYFLRWGQDEMGVLQWIDYCPESLAKQISWITDAQMEQMDDATPA